MFIGLLFIQAVFQLELSFGPLDQLSFAEPFIDNRKFRMKSKYFMDRPGGHRSQFDNRRDVIRAHSFRRRPRGETESNH